MHTKHYTRPFCISTLQATASECKTGRGPENKLSHVSVVRSHWVAFSWVCECLFHKDPRGVPSSHQGSEKHERA